MSKAPWILFRLLNIRSGVLILGFCIGFAHGFQMNARADGKSTRGNHATAASVTLTQQSDSFTLDNGIISARIDKRTGDLVSLKYKDIETLSAASGHAYGYWSHTPGRDSRIVDSVTIDPAKNSGERAEISVKGTYQGTAQGVGPGGSANVDIEIRYAMGRGDQGVYTYSILDHKPDYPATSIGEARFAAKLNDNIFDYMTIDEKRRKVMLTGEDWNRGTQLNMKEARRMNSGRYAGQVEHKYDYSAIQFDTPAYGWSSSEHHIGLWFINPTIEYLSGGATKVELTAHRDSSGINAPTILNYWRGSHYGGSSCEIAKGEAWSKVIGPFLIYCNSGESHDALWKDALAQATKESAKWPYSWVAGVNYPLKNQRGSLSGQIILNDPQSAGMKMTNLLVGLASPNYVGEREVRGGTRKTVDWQMDAKYYQFWARGDRNGRFSIPNIRPGKYTLHVLASGVLGEFTSSYIFIASGKTQHIGRLEWKPIRFGTQLWEIGIPNRSAEEFRHGDDYWHWGLYLKYGEEFPKDVDFTIGKSDFRKDWNYAQVPHADGSGTTWSIRFKLNKNYTGRATLRLAFAATSARNVDVSVNEVPAGSTDSLPDTATIRRDGIRGYWFERNINFDASVLKQGENILKLTIPPGGAMSGVEYDYLRLEVADS